MSEQKGSDGSFQVRAAHRRPELMINGEMDLHMVQQLIKATHDVKQINYSEAISLVVSSSTDLIICRLKYLRNATQA